MIDKANIKDIYPLSPMQEGMLFHALSDPAAGTYFEQVSYRVRGPLNLATFTRAWKYLFDRHDILRTVFLHERTRRPVQVVLKERALEISRHDGSLPADVHRAEEKRRGFDLRSDALLRARVLARANDDHEIILSFHHILMDGWCMGVLHTEFLHVYQAFEAGRTPSLAPAVPYQRYIQWLERQDREAAVRYWKSYLEGFDTPAPLPARRPGAGPYDLQIRQTRLEGARLRAAAKDWGVTVNTLFQTAWAITLSRYTAKTEVTFGTIVSGRPAEIPGVESILGLLINLIPVRARVEGDCRALAQRLQADFLDASSFSYCPVGEIAPPNLIDHILVFENYPDAGGVTTGGLTIEQTGRFEQTNYDFLIVIAPGDSIEVAFHFNASAFETSYIERLHGHYLRTLDLLTRNPPIRDLDPLASAPAISGELIAAPPTGIVQMFEDRVRARPEAVAVVEGDLQWSYRELSERAGALAAILQAAPEDRIAVLIPRSAWLPVALLGVLKSGAVYVPIDVNDPPERIRALAFGCRAVLVTPASPPTGLHSLDITALAPSAFAPLSAHPDQLAYLIHTSGSTGQPNGVMVSHRAALNLVHWHQRTFSVGPASKATLYASPAFDASLWEMLPYLLAGGTLYPVPEDTRTDTGLLAAFLAGHGITHAFVPPAVCEELGRGGQLDPALTLLTGGDVLRGTQGLEGIAVNNYGPTEAAVVATSIPVTGVTPIPIGRPIDNTAILVLDPLLRPVPEGVTGELYIASTGLARGYANRPGLTAERFLPHLTEPGARMYRTGDLGYWRDGALMFSGRRDHQVKVRGVRMELGEIEAALELSPDVAECAAGLDAGHLAAWVVPVSDALDFHALKAFLAQRLPPAMVPARFTLLRHLPRTRNGKLDRSALVCVRRPGRATPATETERQLAAIWSAVLDAPEVGIDDNFFELGGHSLTVTRAVSRIRDQLQVNLPMRAVFETPTIARLAETIEALRSTRGPEDDEPPLVARPRRTVMQEGK